MGKKVKTGKNRKDEYYYMAKSSGLRARSAFKLIEINKLYHILEKATVLIDLCAAPGGWMQVATRTMKSSSIIIGIDLVPIKPIPGTIGIVADITTERCRQLIKQNILTAKADVILHDGAPNVGANWNIDEFAQAHLCLKAFALATEFLAKNGTFVSKVFRSKDYESLKWVFEQLFEKVHAVKPKSSRNESAEIFLVCMKYKAPSFIDPKFLNIESVFGDVKEDECKALTYDRMVKNKRKAEGYDEGDSLYLIKNISEILLEKIPMNTILLCNKIVLDDEEVRNHPNTSETIKQYLLDLKLLGKYDFRIIEKWIKKMIPFYKKTHNIDQQLETNLTLAEPKTEEQQIDEDIERCENEVKRTERKKLKSQRKEKMKQIKMIQMNMLHPGDIIEQVDDVDMFSASKNQHLIEQGLIQTDVDVSTLDKILCLSDDKRRSLAKKESKKKENYTKTSEKYYDSGSDLVRSEDPEDKYSDDEFDESDSEVVEIDVGSGDEEYDNDNEESDDDEDEGDSEEVQDIDDEDDHSIEEEIFDMDVDAYDDEDCDEEVSESEDDDCESEDDDCESEDDDCENEEDVGTSDESASEEINKKSNKVKITDLNFDPSATTPKAKENKRTNAWYTSADFSKLMNDADDSEGSSSEDEIIEDIVNTNKKGNKVIEPVKKIEPKATDDIDKSNPDHAAILNTLKRKLTPKERALAVEMIKSKKSRREILEWGYNRYQFDDEKIPGWLAKEEAKHMRPSMPFLDKEKISKQREVVSTNIGKKTIKKVEQAKARKKNRVMRKLHRLNKRAEKIDDDLTMAERNKKLKEISSKVAKLKSTKKPSAIAVTNKNGDRNRVGKYKKGAKVSVVDRRMKSDKRGRGASVGKDKRGRSASAGKDKRGRSASAGKGRK